MQINLRNAMVAGKRLPYTPLYGVRSDGVAYCALPGRINASSGAFEADFSITSSSYRGDWHAWGAHGGSSNRGHFLLNLQKPTSGAAFAFGIFADPNSGMNLSVGRHVLAVANNTMGLYATLDGVSCLSFIIGEGINNPGQFLIFRASATNSQTNPQASTSPTFITLHRLKVWYGDTQAADLIPCREKSINEVCFFNAIDGQFVKNIAGGSSQLIEAAQTRGGYKLRCVRRSHRRSLRPSARLRSPSVALAKDGWQPRLWKEVA